MGALSDLALVGDNRGFIDDDAAFAILTLRVSAIIRAAALVIILTVPKRFTRITCSNRAMSTGPSRPTSRTDRGTPAQFTTIRATHAPSRRHRVPL